MQRSKAFSSDAHNSGEAEQTLAGNYNEVDEAVMDSSNAADLPPQTILEPATQEDPDVFRILVATDAHLGYAEKDAEIAEDSFRNFEWVLHKARELEVDFLLLGGDLFHENKPSKSTMHRCMTLLRKYCMGDKPVRFQILGKSEALSGASAECGPNWLDENVNVSLPCFTIHGNHDDPTGREFLCPLDALADSRLINYFGKQTQLERVELFPIVLTKGATQIALYGLGSIRDERLYRLFRSNKVVFKKWTNSEQAFHMFVVHQNRVARGSVARIPEETIPSFFDLVIWGHEHDAIATPDWNVSQRFYVIQPGSTVPTSLDEHERGAKYCGLLEVRAKNFRWQKLPIRCTRQLLIETISLREVFGDPNNPRAPDGPHSALLDAALRGALKSPAGKTQAKKRGKQVDSVSSLQVRIEEFCTERVRALVDEAKGERDAEIDVDSTSTPIYSTILPSLRLDKRPEKPLLRLRIDYAGGFETFNASRFGQRFANDVANPETIIKFIRKAARPADRQNNESESTRPAPNNRQADPESRSVEDILCSLLESGSIDERDRVRVINAKLFSTALSDYVSKNTRESLETVVKECIRDAERSVLDLARSHATDSDLSAADLNQDADIEVTDADLEKLVKRYAETANLRELGERIETVTASVSATQPSAAQIPARANIKRRNSPEHTFDEEETAIVKDEPPSRRGRIGGPKSPANTKRAGASADGLKQLELRFGSTADSDSDSDVQVIDEDNQPQPQAKTTRGRGRGGSTTTKTASAAARGRARGRGRGRKNAFDEDDD